MRTFNLNPRNNEGIEQLIELYKQDFRIYEAKWYEPRYIPSAMRSYVKYQLGQVLETLRNYRKDV